jgi:hypothetical protein
MRRVMAPGWAALTVALLSLGCASARIRETNAIALARADARVLEGCYDCLRDARDTYARLATDKHVPKLVKGAPSILARQFETEILIALREKELALDPRASMERARAIAPRLPRSLEPERVLAIVDAVLPDGAGVPLKLLDSLRLKHRPLTARLTAELAWVDSSALTPDTRKYVGLALACSYMDGPKSKSDTANPLVKRRALPINAPPLLAYRGADCAEPDTLALKRVLYAVPSFAEAGYSMAGLAVMLAGETGGDAVRILLDSARARFPRAPGVHFQIGYLSSVLGECESATAAYTQTLALQPAHDRAMLQKTICLTHLRRDSAAIATATQFIALGTLNIHEGYYWRAANRLRRRELELARSDIDSAKARSKGGDVLTMAGIIEHEQEDLPIAELDLRGARAAHRGESNCSAAFYLGSVYHKRETWAGAAASYDSAMVCYGDRVHLVAAKIEEVRMSTKGSAAFRAKKIAGLETDLADVRKRYYSSAYNVASMTGKLGNLARAEELLAVAAQSADLTEQVAKLRDIIDQAKAAAKPASAPGRRVAQPRR